MFCDEIVEEVREIRQKHAARFNYDLHKIVEDLNKKQQQYGRKTISFSPKPPSTAKNRIIILTFTGGTPWHYLLQRLLF